MSIEYEHITLSVDLGMGVRWSCTSIGAKRMGISCEVARAWHEDQLGVIDMDFLVSYES